MVRLIRADELPGLLRLYGNFHPQGLVADHHEPKRKAIWQAILANPSLRYYVAEVDGLLVSSCTLTIIPNLNHDGRPYGLMENVVTDPAYRKKGLATAVLRHALDDAWAAQCYKVMLLTGSKQEETLRFYEGAGFQRGVKTGFIAFPPQK